MKRRFLVCLVGCVTAAILAGCVPPICSKCLSVSGGTVVDIIYPDGSRTSAIANDNGCVVVSTRGYSCSQITAQPVRRIGIFFAAPSSIDLQAPPPSITITGEAISTSYGMPKVQFYNEYETLVAEVTASDVAPDGSWLTAPTPGLGNVYTGQYSVEVSNVTPYGTTEVIGAAQLNTYGRDRVDADGDGWYADEECDDNDPNVNPSAPPDCNGLYYDRNCNGIPDSQECGDPCADGSRVCYTY